MSTWIVLVTHLVEANHQAPSTPAALPSPRAPAEQELLRADVVMGSLRASVHRVSINFLARRRQADVATTCRSPRPMMNRPRCAPWQLDSGFRTPGGDPHPLWRSCQAACALGSDVVLVETLGLLLGVGQHLAGSFGVLVITIRLVPYPWPPGPETWDYRAPPLCCSGSSSACGSARPEAPHQRRGCCVALRGVDRSFALRHPPAKRTFIFPKNPPTPTNMRSRPLGGLRSA